eukprot:NODE_691_length_4696_cov_0.623885.p5 type:complete len:141 gc:universal NODE_691_length_4696_cov_0.623885:3826-3404(-)
MMEFLKIHKKEIKNGNYLLLAKMIAMMGVLTGVTAVILACINTYDLEFPIFALALVCVSALLELPNFKASRVTEHFKRNAVRAIWYLFSGMIFIFLPNTSSLGQYDRILYITTGILQVISGIFYALTSRQVSDIQGLTEF